MAEIADIRLARRLFAAGVSVFALVPVGGAPAGPLARALARSLFVVSGDAVAVVDAADHEDAEACLDAVAAARRSAPHVLVPWAEPSVRAFDGLDEAACSWGVAVVARAGVVDERDLLRALARIPTGRALGVVLVT